jgi:predicted RNase H-like HicB family nuclease
MTDGCMKVYVINTPEDVDKLPPIEELFPDISWGDKVIVDDKTYDVVIEKDRDVGGYVIEVPSLHGCHTQGESMEEVIANIKDLIPLYLKTRGQGA